MAPTPKTGVLLINLGTPDAATPEAVGTYLREFLMDPFVVDIPYPARWFLVNAIVLPKRKNDSAALYRKIWSEAGSPLLMHTLALEKASQARLGPEYFVKAAMRYGRPALSQAIEAIKGSGVSRLVVFPLYPQYSAAASESSTEAARYWLRKLGWNPPTTWIPPFYARPEYLNAVVEVSRPVLAERPYDMVLFSFHGLPERQIKRSDKSRPRKHCLASRMCCDSISLANRDCYRAHCFFTARQLATRLGIAPEQYKVCFQSRLGRTPWIRPYTDELYRTLPAQGIKRLAVLCPSFVADCLETLEEVQIRGNEEFRRHGGESLYLVPSLNASEVWAGAVAKLVSEN